MTIVYEDGEASWTPFVPHKCSECKEQLAQDGFDLCRVCMEKYMKEHVEESE